jgi:hypothetical protein
MPSQAQDYCVPAFDVGAASTLWRSVALSFVTVLNRQTLLRAQSS